MERDMKNMGPYTKKAFERIVNSENKPELSDPIYVMGILVDEKKTNFKTFATQLKETMVNKGLCQEDDPLSKFIKELGERLFEIESSSKNGKSIKKESLIRKSRKWLNDKNRIDSFDEAVKVCFALNLDYYQSIEFLNKIGFHSFNLRDAKETLYLYCILANKPYHVAENLIDKYNEYEVETDNNSTDNKSDINTTFKTKKESSNTDTTLFVRKFMKEYLPKTDDWEDEEKFLKNLIIPNKSIFIGYSKGTVIEYYRLKVYYIAFYLINKLEILIQINAKEAKNCSENDSKTFYKYIERVTELEKVFLHCSAEDSVFKKLKVKINADSLDISNFKDYISVFIDCLFDIIEKTSKTADIDTLSKIVECFNKVISSENIYLDTISSLKKGLIKDAPLITRLNSSERFSERLMIADVEKTAKELSKQAILEDSSFDLSLPCKNSKQRQKVFKLADKIKKEYISNNSLTNPDLRCAQNYLINILLTFLPSEEITQLNEANVEIYTDRYNDSQFIIKTLSNGKEKRFIDEKIHLALKSYLTEKSYGRQMNNSDFSVSETVLANFPNKDFFRDFEKSPSTMYIGKKQQTGKSKDRKLPTRKGLIIMFYIAYSYNSAINLSYQNYYSPFDNRFGFNTFLEKINEMLDRCQMGIMEPSTNHFDWLILRSFFDLTRKDKKEHAIDPIYFLNGILNLSHEDKNKKLTD